MDNISGAIWQEAGMAHQATGLSVLRWLSEAGNSRQPYGGNKVWWGPWKVARVRLFANEATSLSARVCNTFRCSLLELAGEGFGAEVRLDNPLD